IRRFRRFSRIVLPGGTLPPARPFRPRWPRLPAPLHFFGVLSERTPPIISSQPASEPGLVRRFGLPPRTSGPLLNRIVTPATAPLSLVRGVSLWNPPKLLYPPVAPSGPCRACS